MKVKNVHERTMRTGQERARAIFDSLATKKDRIWPRRKWPALRLDAPKENLGKGGHGPIRYRVTRYEPGKNLTFAFEQKGLSKGLHGVHFFELEPSGDGDVTARHVIEAELGWPAFVLWPLLIRPLHDALVEDALDNFEWAATDSLPKANHYSPYVRLLRALAFPRDRS